MREISDSERLFGNEFTSIATDGLAGTLVLEGTDVTQSGDFEIDVADGRVSIDGIVQDVAAETAIGVTEPAAGAYRYDVVTRDGLGDVVVTEGTTGEIDGGNVVDPATAPDRPAGHAMLATLRVFDDGIDQVFDGRTVVNLPPRASSPSIVSTTMPEDVRGGTQWTRLDESGTGIWQSAAGNNPRAVYEVDGIVFVADVIGQANAYDAYSGEHIDGTSQFDGATYDLIVRDDTIYLGRSSGDFNDNDTLVAIEHTDGEWASAPTWGAQPHGEEDVNGIDEQDGVVVSGADDGTVAASDAADGTILWDNDTVHTDTVRDVFVWRRSVFTVSDDGTVASLDIDDGSENWTHSYHDDGVRAIFVRNGVAYSTGYPDQGAGLVVAATAAGGEKIWEHEHHDERVRTVFERKGVVYSGDNDGKVIAVDAESPTKLWEHDHGGFVYNLFERNGMLFLVSTSDDVLAIVSDPSSYVYDGEEWLFQSRLGADRDGGQLG